MVSRRRVITLGVAANAYGQAVSVLVQILTIPVLLSAWGAQLYGEWLIVSTIPAYLALADLGLSAVGANEMTMLYARGDFARVAILYKSVRFIILLASIIFAAIVIAVAYAFPIGHIFSLSILRDDQIVGIVTVLSIYTIFSLQGSVMDGAYRASGKYALGTMITNTVRLVEWMAVVGVAILGATPIQVALALLIARGIGLIVSVFILRRTVDWIKSVLCKPSMDAVRSLLKPAAAYLVMLSGNALSIQGIQLIVGALASPVAVAIFSVYRTLGRLMLQGVNLVNHALWPEFSRLYGLGNLTLLRLYFLRSIAFSIWFSIASVIFLMIAGDSIIDLWTKGRIGYDDHLLFLLLLGSAIGCCWQTAKVVLLATNLHWKVGWVYLLSAVLSVSIAALLVSSDNIHGVAIAIIVGELLAAIVFVRWALIVIGGDMRGLGRMLLRPKAILYGPNSEKKAKTEDVR